MLEKGDAEDEMHGVTDPMDVNLSKLLERVKDREAWRAATAWGCKESDATG